MKLLLDENLSRRLLFELQALFPGSTHVVLMGLESASDQDVWERAAAEGSTIVTKDADFVELAVLRGAPPKVIRLAIGNVPNDVVHACLIPHVAAISRFATSDEAILELDVVRG